MKKRVTVILCVMLAVVVAFGVSDFKGEQKTGWIYKTKIKETQGAFTYHAVMSKNKKEAWIYYIEVNTKKVPETLSIPKKIKGKKVTRLGASKKFSSFYDCTVNIFGSAVERFHDYPGDTSKTKTIQKLKIPETVTVIQPTAFSGMVSLQKVTIPKKVKELKKETFYGCSSLTNVNLPAGLKKLDAAAFQDCPSLKKLKIPSKNKTYRVKDKCVIAKKEKELIYVLPTGQPLDIPEGIKVLKKYAFNNATSPTVNIPASVVKIEGDAFSVAMQGTNGAIKDVTVSADNAVYAKDGQCIYDKTNKSLSVAIVNEARIMRISEQVERLDKTCNLVNIDIYEEHCKKLIYPKSLQSAEVPALNYIDAKKVYFLGSNPPVVENLIEGYAPLPIFTDVYVPEASLQTYRDWYKKYDCDDSVNSWNTFLSEDEI